MQSLKDTDRSKIRGQVPILYQFFSRSRIMAFESFELRPVFVSSKILHFQSKAIVIELKLRKFQLIGGY